MRDCESIDGVGGTILDPLWVSWFPMLLSGVVNFRPRLLGRFLGGFGGTMNAGVGGAENA